MYNFAKLKTKSVEIEAWLQKEFSGIRTSRATPSILDNVLAESYGAKMPIKQLASISSEDARTLRISPFDPEQVKAIEKAIAAANLGLSVAVDDRGLRIAFPELTSERREALMKVAKEKLEQARISMRQLRDEVWKDIEGKEKGGEVSEDEKFRLKTELQKQVDSANKTLADFFDKKEKEISN